MCTVFIYLNLLHANAPRVVIIKKIQPNTHWPTISIFIEAHAVYTQCGEALCNLLAQSLHIYTHLFKLQSCTYAVTSSSTRSHHAHE